MIYHKLLKYKEKKEKEKDKEEKNGEKEKTDNEEKEKKKKEEKEKLEKKDEGKEGNNNGIKKEEEKINKENKEKNGIKLILIIHFNKDKINITSFNKGEFHNKLKISDSNEINFCDIDINKKEEIFNLIKKISDNIKQMEIILTKDKNLKEGDSDLIENIIKYCQEKINPPISVFEYDINEISHNIINYIY